MSDFDLMELIVNSGTDDSQIEIRCDKCGVKFFNTIKAIKAKENRCEKCSEKCSVTFWQRLKGYFT